jgi:P27 family predicted phage terminase small subunit
MTSRRRGRRDTVPTALKVLRGNPGKRALPPHEAHPPIGAGLPPPDLAGEALTEWHRRVPALEAQGLITSLDWPAFVAYCQAWARYVEANSKVGELGEVVMTRSGHPIPNPHRGVANRALKFCQQFWFDFGMTPAARSHVDAQPLHFRLVESKWKGLLP